MRRLSALVGLVVLSVTATAADDPRDLIRRAIKAEGGTAVKQLTARHYHMQAKIHLPEPASLTITVQGEQYSEQGQRERGWLEGDVLGRKIRVVDSYDGKKGWTRINEDVRDDSALQLECRVWNNYFDRLADLNILLEDRSLTLTALGESRVNGKAVQGVKVSSKGHEDASLFFDPDSGRLVKMSFPHKDSTKEGKIQKAEIYYQDYRPVDLASSAERILREAGMDVSKEDLVAALRKQVPAVGGREKAEALIRSLGDDAFAEREKASKELVALGMVAVPLLKEACSSADAEVRRRARLCLEKLHPQQNETRLTATVRLIALRQPRGASAVLLDYLPAAPEDVAREVRAALHHLAQKNPSDPALTAALKDRIAFRRAAAQAALGKDGGAYLRQPGRRLYVTSVVQPMKTIHYFDGRKSLELEVSDLEFFNRFDDKLFTKP